MLVLFALSALWACTANGHSSREEMPTFQMHERCGGTVNLKWESIFTAKIELRPSNIVVNHSAVDVVNLPGRFQAYEHLPSQQCQLHVESWDFQNRLMVIFEELFLGNGTSCSGSSLEVLDGPDERSPRLQGLPSTICSYHTKKLLSKSFVTSDKYMTIRFHGNGITNNDVVLRAVIVAFKEGPCRTYEYECANYRCILSDLACNGHNPCGDNSDCPVSHPPVEVTTAEEQDHVLLAAIIVIATVLVILIITAVVVFRCYQIRRKNRRLRQHHGYIEAPRNPNPESTFQRSVSQIELEKRFAPPSYATLVGDKEPEITIEETPAEEIHDKCLEADENNPPSYACVLLHKEEYHVSETNIPEVTFTECDT